MRDIGVHLLVHIGVFVNMDRKKINEFVSSTQKHGLDADACPPWVREAMARAQQLWRPEQAITRPGFSKKELELRLTFQNHILNSMHLHRGPDEIEFTLHSALVASQSPKLARLLNEQFIEALEHRVKCPYVDQETFVRFSQYLYTGWYYEAQPEKRPVSGGNATNQQDSEQSMESQPTKIKKIHGHNSLSPKLVRYRRYQVRDEPHHVCISCTRELSSSCPPSH